MSISPGKTYNPAVITPGRRDAFHCASVLCRTIPESKYHIDPGDRVVLINDTDAAWFDEDTHADWDGVADPFAEEIDRQSLFWVFLRPERVKDLTHTFRIELPELEKRDGEVVPNGDWNAACRKCES